MGPNPQFSADLVTFTEEILNGKLHFLCSVSLIITLTMKLVLIVSCINSFQDNVPILFQL